MKHLLLITLIFSFMACQQIEPALTPKQQFSTLQKKLVGLLDRYKEAKYTAGNQLQKGELRRKYLDSAKALLFDSAKYHMSNFKVIVDQIKTSDIRDQKAFYAKFYDNDGSKVESVTMNEYWMEFDYPQDSLKALEQTPAYKLLKNIPENADTTISFFSLGDVEWKGSTEDQFKIRVVPFPKNFNFDSSRNANAKR